MLADELCDSFKKTIMQEPGGSRLINAGSSTSSSVAGASTETESLSEVELVETTHKRILKKLMIACLTLCLISSITYTTACGTELCNQFMEGRVPE